MTDSERERIAVLESEVRHTNEKIDKVIMRQDEMYSLLSEGKGSYKTLLAVAGLTGLLASLAVKLAPLLLHFPK